MAIDANKFAHAPARNRDRMAALDQIDTSVSHMTNLTGANEVPRQGSEIGAIDASRNEATSRRAWNSAAPPLPLKPFEKVIGLICKAIASNSGLRDTSEGLTG